MHRTLKEETALPPAENGAKQQERFDAFMKEYNEIRPHEAIGMRPPASLWRPSSIRVPDKLAKPVYPLHMTVRSVRPNGAIKFKGRSVFLSEVLARETIALEEVEDGVWSIYFYNILLGRLSAATMKILPAGPKPGRPTTDTKPDEKR